MEIKVTVSGLPELLTAIEALKPKIDLATEQATKTSVEYLQSRAVHNFEGAHPVGTWHVGGDSPNTVTGNLQRSIIYSPVAQMGQGVYTTRIGPTAIYSRVIELGAHITPKEARYLSWFDAQFGVQRYLKHVDIPPRPYFTPAYESLIPRIGGFFGVALEAALA